MGYPGPVCCCQRSRNLLDHSGRGIGGESRVVDDIPQTPATHQLHCQIRRIRLPPVVVERNDVGVLESGDQLGFGLKPADEGRIIGKLGSDDLDRHLAAHHRLIGPIDDAEAALAELLAQLVAADCKTRFGTRPGELQGRGSLECRISGDDLLLQPGDPARRLDPQLLTQSRLEELV